MSNLNRVESQPDVRIRKGSVVVYRVFDIGDHVDIKRAEDILSQQIGKLRLGLNLKRRSSIVIQRPPVRFQLGEYELKFGNSTIKAEIFATLWDYGALSIAFQIPLQNAAWSELMALSGWLQAEEEGARQIDFASKLKATEVLRLLNPAIQKVKLWEVSEDYIIYFLNEVEGIVDGADLIRKTDIPALILGEAKIALSEQSKVGIAESILQYGKEDIIVIDWNSALVLEPSGQTETLDVFEFALSHLLEVRFYDDLLDQRLSELYKAVQAKRKGIFKNLFAGLLKEANTRFIEFSELTERVDNSLKIVGDFYLATVFRGCLKEFRISDWQKSITRKMDLFAQISGLLHDEVNVQRSTVLELVIILLIVFETITAFLHRGA